jgi:hypothetical protein
MTWSERFDRLRDQVVQGERRLVARRRGRGQYHGVLLKQSMSLKRNGVVD